ncbi:MAG: hypothetical protein ACREHD_00515 [Pirellulales bacterium]
MKRFESTGLWFLPTDPEKQIAGRIRFSRENGISLELAGTFQANWGYISAPRYELIQGIVAESPYGRFISLFDCFATNLKTGMPGLSLETLLAHHGFIGADFVPSIDTKFNEATVYFPTLSRWLNISGLEMMASPDVIVKWHKHEPLKAEVRGGYVSTAFELSEAISPDPASISVVETPAFLVQCRESSSADEIHHGIVGPIAYLMTFAADKPSPISRYTLQLVDNEDEIKSFDRFYSPIDEPASKKKGRRRNDPLFYLRDVPEGFSSFLPRWFAFVESHPDFCAMFFSYAYRGANYAESRFLFRMLAIQLLAKEQYSDDPVWSRMAEARSAALALDQLSGQPFPDFNIPSVPQMVSPTLVAKLLSEHWALIKSVVGTDGDSFLPTLFSTLDYVTTRLPLSNRAKTEWSDLVWLSERLSAAIKLIMLRILGFSDDRIVNIIATNGDLSHLRRIKQPWASTSQ